MVWLLKLTFLLAGSYAFIVCVAYLLQTWLIFPAGLVGGTINLPQEARYIELETKDREQVFLVRIPPSRKPSEPRPLLIGFGGNAWNADAVAVLLHRVFPEHEVVALHYRGYHPSSGRPSASTIFNDARLGYDSLANDRGNGVVAIGFSIGASVAVELAASRPVQGLVMVTPFDSLKELAATHYPWLPVRWLLRHRMEAAAALRNLDIPVALITAENDAVVPRSRSQPVLEAAKKLRQSFVVRDAGHNDLYHRRDFDDAIRICVESVSRD